MELINIRDLFRDKEKYLGNKVTVGGWVRSVRDSKTFGFIVVNDGTFFEPLQVVYHDTMENFAQISRLNVGAAIIVTGTLIATPDAKQPFEIQAYSVISYLAPGGNIDKKVTVKSNKPVAEFTFREEKKTTKMIILPYDGKNSYRVSVNGVMQFTADKSAVDKVIKQFTSLK